VISYASVAELGCSRLTSIVAPKAAGATDEHQLEYTIALYERALNRDATNHLLMFDLAWAYAGRGGGEQAAGLLERILQLYPRSAMVHYKAARIYRRIGQLMAAIKCYRQTLKFDPLHPHATEILVDMAVLAGMYGHGRRSG
jgi:tetratricopeptide (TPR) repeat protein